MVGRICWGALFFGWLQLWIYYRIVISYWIIISGSNDAFIEFTGDSLVAVLFCLVCCSIFDHTRFLVCLRLLSDALVQDIDKEALSSDIVCDESFYGSEISLSQIFHQLGTFERFLDLLEDASCTGSYFLKFVHKSQETPTTVSQALLFPQYFIGANSCVWTNIVGCFIWWWGLSHKLWTVLVFDCGCRGFCLLASSSL